MVSFSNTKIAFSGKSNTDLNRSYILFKLLSKPSWVALGSNLTLFALKFRLPITWAVKQTIFKQFCGGDNIDDCTETINKLGEFKIGAILDFSIEGKESEMDFDNTMQEIISTITKATQSNHIPFSVFKVTGIATVDLLEKISENKKGHICYQDPKRTEKIFNSNKQHYLPNSERNQKISNKLKGRKINWSKTKPVLQYDLEGNFIKEWSSGVEAGKFLNKSSSSISECCSNKRKTAYKFIWKYKN
jgi:hypothetical protein